MSSTPEIKTILNKSSPFRSGISKALLTPCRPVGLSRKRKTPNNITNLLSDNLSTSRSESLSLELTPVNHGKLLKKESKINYKSPVNQVNEHKLNVTPSGIINCVPADFSTSISSEITPLNHKKISKSESKINYESPVNKGEEIKWKAGNTSLAKKQLAKKFSADLFDKETDMSSSNDECNGFKRISEELTNNEVSMKENSPSLINKDETTTSVFGELSNSTLTTKRKIENCKYDSDEDFKIDSSNKSKLKKSQSVEVRNKKEVNIRKITSSKSLKGDTLERSISTLTCRVSIEKLSDEDIKVNTFSTKTNESPVISDDENFGKRKKKKVFVLSDDEDECFSSVLPKPTCEIPATVQGNSNKGNNVSTKTVMAIIEDEEDAFTSTPEREKFEKGDLINKVKALEIQVKKKRERLEDLKQAAIYKSKHNIDELTTLTEKWRRGCIVGLNELLAKLQAHGPMDMAMLLNNLHISSDVAKLYLDLK